MAIREFREGTRMNQGWPTRKQFFAVLLVYFGLHLIVRTVISETIALDEADQIVVAQRLSWGYGPQAPLYTWLLTLFLRVFGSSIFSLALLRETLLFSSCLLAYFNARTLTRR